jgi:DNA-binding CsgD family transcriptional regulator
MTRANRKNPFGLTYRECELLEALIRLGSPKAVAYEEDSNVKTVRNTLTAACKKMGVTTYIQAVVEFDRKRRVGLDFQGAQRVRSVFDLGLHA